MLYWLMVMVLGVFCLKLIQLQVFEVGYYRALADENRVKLVDIPAERGNIYDRYGEALAVSQDDGRRNYRLGSAAAQVIGYVGETDELEAEELGLGKMVGKMGIEKYYDKRLRGIDGLRILEQEADGTVVRELRRILPVKGEDLRLSLDSGLQRKAAEIMDSRKGAIIATVPQTGEVLALVSSPSFDPDNLVQAINDKNLPLFNRAIGGEYPPASTFKVITAVAGLEEGKIKPEELIEDTGEIKIGPYRFGNWYFDRYGKTDGRINLVRALARSNDIFFYRLGEKLGINRLANWAKYFGLNEKTGIDLFGEAKGLIPDEAWKEKVLGEDWYLGDTFISAIGQGNVLATPIQVNQMMSVIANNGQWCRPQILMTKEKDCRQLEINPKTLATVKQGLVEVCQPGGTAWPFFNFEVKSEESSGSGKIIQVAGKTGTAEFGPTTEEKTHAWFSGFAPVEQPEITVTVLLEEAGEGSYQAAPAAKELLNYWFQRQ